MNLLQRLKKYIAINFSLHKNQTKRIISFWEKGGADFEYFEKADQAEWLKVFWGEDSKFISLFKRLNLKTTLEIACGAARHSAKVIDQIEHLYLLDSSKGALDIARKNLSKYPDITYIHNAGGLGIPATVLNNSLTAVFSYDAMVHFEKEAVFSYIKDSYRVLSAGGAALFHHSNYQKNPDRVFTNNPGWRNFMSQELFTSYATECGFEVIHSEVISFSAEDSDCITLLRKN